VNTSKARSAKKGYTKKDMDAVSDNPKWTKADFEKAKPFAEAFPALAATIRRRGPQKTPTKKAISIRLSADVIEHFKATGDGWQSRIDDTLRKAAKIKARA
jgi:uncharacterized protein (DUF4415 family)